MKFINGVIKEVILEENDTLLISSLQGNKCKLKITLEKGIIEIDDISIKKIEQIREEEEAIQIMKKFQLKKQKK